jgi:hypothetical protein
LSTQKTFRSRDDVWRLAIYFEKCAYFKNLHTASVGKGNTDGSFERGQFIAEFCKEL